MAITREEVKHTARLARLKLTDDEVTLFTEQLGRIMGYIEKLKQADTSKIETTSYVHPLKNVARPDKIEKRDDSENILQNAPEREENFFSVKKVIE